MASLSFHAWYVGIKTKIGGEYVPSSALASNYHMARGSDFEGEPEIENEDFEANCGQATTLLGSDRTGASSNPSWEQKAIFGEFFEEACYMLLGDKTITNIELDGSTQQNPLNAYQWKFSKSTDALPLATIKNSYFYTGGTTMIYNNAKMSTWEMKFDDKGVNMTYEFASDVVSPNNTNPVDKNIPTTLSKLGVQDFKVYIGDFGDALFNPTTSTVKQGITPYDCVTEGSIKFDNNLDDFICLGNEFGRSFKDNGDFKGEGDLTVKWNTSTDDLIGKWLTGTANGKQATDQSYYAELLIVANGKKLGTVTPSGGTETDVNEKFIVYLPKVEIKKAWSDLAGNDTKTISIEYETVANSTSPCMEIISTYEKLTNE